MHNIKLTISYDGTHFSGWQKQNTPEAAPRTQRKTIQGIIEAILEKIFQKKITLIGSGRTDAGVHAVGQVANFKTEKYIQPAKLIKALNGLLPEDIVITKAEESPLDFNSRFWAKAKIYRYVIINQKVKPAFVDKWGLWIKYPLNVKLMKEEARCLVGRHDFKSFQASDKFERNSITTIKDIRIKKSKRGYDFPFLSGLELVTVEVEAKGFLYNMVRNIVGTLLEVGRDRLKKGGLKDILRKADRSSAGPCAPARGLYLIKVLYE